MPDDQPLILTVTPNPCVDKTVFVKAYEPGQFIRADRYVCIAGGKGVNVSRAIRRLGGRTEAFVIVGGHTGAQVVEYIERGDHVPCRAAVVADDTRTITTIYEEEPKRQTAFFEPGSRITDDEAERIIGEFADSIREARVVAFCGTVSDPTLQELYANLIPIAHESNLVTILDSHGAEFKAGVAAAPYMVKPNLAEAAEFCGYALDSKPKRWEAVARFHDAGVKLVVISLGAEGALVSQGDESFQAIAPEIEEVNAVGSGDAL
ncbi:MAG: PfkB family carbohydrate kinase, partial [Candidatus Hydrogenedentales bacterium]